MAAKAERDAIYVSRLATDALAHDPTTDKT